MPLKFQVDFEGERALKVLADLRERVSALDELHDAMGVGVADLVRTHIATKKKSPNTGWWSRVADSVTHTATAEGATVSVPERGAALRYYGGTVRRKTGGPLLTIPTKSVPVQNGTRLAARDMGLLAFLPSRRGNGTKGFLVEGEAYTRTRGKNKGKPGVRQKKGGRLFYVLREFTEHRADASVLPKDEEIARAARDAALDYLAPELE